LTQIRRRAATPSRAFESIRRTCWQQCLNASINHPPPRDVSNYGLPWGG
jgi:hypothetical protein